MKRILVFLCALLLIFSFTACENAKKVLDVPAKGKTFTVDNFSITLTDDFFHMDSLVESCDFCISSEDIVIAGFQVSFEELGEVSARDYAEVFRTTMDQDTMSEIRELDGIPVMQYESASKDGVMQIVYIAVYESDDSLWLVEFISDKDFFEQEQSLIEQYAKSVVCS